MRTNKAIKHVGLFTNSARGGHVHRALHSFGFDIDRFGEMDVRDPKIIASLEGYDLFIVAGYPRIFPKKLLESPKHGTWNCHAGPVPEYRGGSPLNWQIIDGKEDMGISLLQMDEGIDTGPVLNTRSFRLHPHQTIADAHEIANPLFGEMVVECLSRPLRPKKQVKSGAYRRQRNDAMGELDPSWDAERQHNFIRALTHPYPGAWMLRGGKRIRIWRSSIDG
jgi:methionyl-tRNA formyltransferase